MVFSSLLFLFIFLPAVLLLYYVSPWRLKNLILFLTSLVFYAWGEPIYIVLMLLSTVTDYFFGLLLDRQNMADRVRKLILVSSLIVNLAVLENFNKPYTAESITDFWRRWHISLGTWFKDYVYIPLGGNRRGLFIQLRNILVVWTLTGIWHGASWNFLLWGLYFGIILIAEKWFALRLLDRLPKWLRHSYALFLILIGWVFFAFDELPNVASYFGAMFGANGAPLWDQNALYLLYTNAVLLVLLVVASLRKPLGSRALTLHPAIAMSWHGILLFMSIAYLVDATFNPFLYFRF